MKTTEFRLKHKLNEVFILEPNDLHINLLTNWYKKITAHLKTMPFIVIIPCSIIIGIVLYLVLGRFLVKLVTLLQYGF